MTKFNERVPKTPRELELFYIQTVNKLKSTDTTLSDEEQKSINPVIGMVQDLSRRIEMLEKSQGRRIKSSTEKKPPILVLKANIARLEARIKDIERQL